MLQRAAQGRFLPLSEGLRQHTVMLQCTRRESAISGHSLIADERLLHSESGHLEAIAGRCGRILTTIALNYDEAGGLSKC